MRYEDRVVGLNCRSDIAKSAAATLPIAAGRCSVPPKGLRTDARDIADHAHHGGGAGQPIPAGVARGGWRRHVHAFSASFALANRAVESVNSIDKN